MLSDLILNNFEKSFNLDGSYLGNIAYVWHMVTINHV